MLHQTSHHLPTPKESLSPRRARTTRTATKPTVERAAAGGPSEEPGPAPERKRSKRAPQPMQIALVPDALLTVATLCALTGESVATTYRRWADPDANPLYPRPIRLGKRCVRVTAAQTMVWLKAQAEASK